MAKQKGYIDQLDRQVYIDMFDILGEIYLYIWYILEEIYCKIIQIDGVVCTGTSINNKVYYQVDFDIHPVCLEIFYHFRTAFV